MNQVDLTFTCDDGNRQASVSLSTESPWCSFLGAIALPVAGTLDQLDQLLAGTRIQSAILRGHPAACLLPILWIRSIWGAYGTTSVTIVWNAIDCSAEANPPLLPATRLACLLADNVQCDNSDQVLDQYGFSPANPGTTEDVFDLLTNIVDVWDPNLRSAVLGEDWTSEMRSTLSRCATDECHRVAVYGAGTHTRAIGEALMAPPVEVACIIDDDARRHGEHLWGYPIVSPEQAMQMDLDAVVLSANSIEDLLWDRSACFRENGVRVYRVYGESHATEEHAHAAR